MCQIVTDFVSKLWPKVIFDWKATTAQQIFTILFKFHKICKFLQISELPAMTV